MRVRRVDRMPSAGDDDDGNLALALAERIAGAKMRAKRAGDRRQLRVVHPDLGWPGQAAAALDQPAISLLLLRRHPIVRDLGVTAEGRGLGHLLILDGGWDR